MINSKKSWWGPVWHTTNPRNGHSPASKRQRMARVIIAMIIIAASFQAVISCSREDATTATLDTYLQRAMEVWQFNGAVLVARSDRVLLREGYGYADIQNSRPNTPDTKFLIGSMTKPFTAIAILQLAEQGLLDLDTPLSAYLPHYPAAVADIVTIHHLLSHTSGIPDVINVPDFQARADKPITPMEIVAYFADLPSQFEPGARYAYSSSNYVLLGLIVEAVSGQPWADYIREHVCGPAEMGNTGVYLDYRDRPDFAIGYNPDSRGSLAEARVIHPSCGYAAGSLASTVDDLYRLDRALYDTVLLKKASIGKMLEPHSPVYGYGWLVDDVAGHRLTAHGGAVPGYVSMLHRWIDDSVCVVVLSNNVSVPVHTLATGLAAIVLNEPYEMPVTKQPDFGGIRDLEEYTGVYRIDSADFRLIARQGERLTAQRLDGLPQPMLPEARDTFYFERDQMTTLTFFRDDSDRIIGHVLRQTFSVDTAMKVEGAEADRLRYGDEIRAVPDSVLSKYPGQYKIEPAGFVLTITFREGTLFGQAFDSQEIELLPLADGSFAFRGLTARVTFLGEVGAVPDSLRFSQAGTTMIGIRVKQE